MIEKQYVSLNSDGSVEYVTEQRSHRNLNGDIIAKIGSLAVRHTPRVFMQEENPVGILASDAELFAYMFTKTLKINCTFKVNADKTLSPIYLNKDGKAGNPNRYPQFIAQWKVPESMRLMFAAKVSYMGSQSLIGYKSACLLIAWDSAKRARRLPLPNLYDNCYMCMGEYNGLGKNIQESFAKAVGQLDMAEWSSDLLTNDRLEGSDAMLKFKPAEGGDMESIPFTENWASLCPTAGGPLIEILGDAL